MPLKRPRSTQGSRNNLGHLTGDPSGRNTYPATGVGNSEVKNLTPHTSERALKNPSRLATRMTKFTASYTGQVKIPGNIISGTRGSSGDQTNSGRSLDVGQVPED